MGHCSIHGTINATLIRILGEPLRLQDGLCLSRLGMMLWGKTIVQVGYLLAAHGFLAASVVHRGTKTELMLQEMICESKHTNFGFLMP